MIDELDREQAPLRWRLYSSQPEAGGLQATDAIEAEDSLEVVETEYVHSGRSDVSALSADTLVIPSEAPVATVTETPTATPQTPSETTAPTWRAPLDRAIEQTDQRVDQWITEQRRQLADGLDTLVSDLQERRQQEIARLEAWRMAEHARVQRELVEEEGRFRKRLMDELIAFEEQLGARLLEQEQRLAQWWDEAEQVAQQRFAGLVAPPTPEARKA